MLLDLHRLGLQGSAAGGQGLLGGGEDGAAGDGSAGDPIHRNGVRGHHGAGHQLHSPAADPGRLLIPRHLHIGQRAVSQGQADGHIASKALGGGGKGTGLGSAGNRNGDIAGQLDGTRIILVPLHLDAQQLAQITHRGVGDALGGKDSGGCAVGSGGSDLLAVNGQVHGRDRDGLLHPGRHGDRPRDHRQRHCKCGDPFFHILLSFFFFGEFSHPQNCTT